MKHKSKNGYFKHYNKEGIACRIKVAKSALKKFNDEFIVKFKDAKDEFWMWHVPHKRFRDASEVIVFILKNLDSDNMVFKIV